MMTYLKYGIGLVTLSLLNGLISYAQPEPPCDKMWEIYDPLSDEFDSWNSTKWTKSLWNYGEPVNMKEENSGVSDGNLWIKATLNETDTVRWFNTSRVMSVSQISYPMYTECNMRTDNLSAYATYWLNNGNIANRDEFDIIEHNTNPSRPGHEDRPYTMYSQYFLVVDTIVERHHGNFDNRKLSDENPAKGKKWNEEFQVLGAWWIDANNIQFYINGEPAGKVKSTRDFTRELNVIWDLWTIDANWSGGIARKENLLDDSMNTYYIDWIHTYKLVDAPTVPVTDVSLQDTLSLDVKEKKQLIAIVSPDSTTECEIKWSVLDEDIAKVSIEGLVTGVGDGVTKVIVETVSGGLKDTCEVTVTGEPQVGIENKILNANLRVSPNPVHSDLKIAGLEELDGPTHLSIINLQGQTVFEQIIEEPNQVISVDGYASGMYILTLRNGSGIKSLPFIKAGELRE